VIREGGRRPGDRRLIGAIDDSECVRTLNFLYGAGVTDKSSRRAAATTVGPKSASMIWALMPAFVIPIRGAEMR
jgi:hypothetical protein